MTLVIMELIMSHAMQKILIDTDSYNSGFC